MWEKFVLGEDIIMIPSGSVSTASAMKYTAVFACVRVLSETFASVPIMLYRKKDDGDRESVNDLAIYDIMHNRPNDEMSPFNFKEACMVALNTGGNAVCERLVNRRGELVGLYPYQWQQVDIKRDPDTQQLQYAIRGNGVKPVKTLTRDQVFHVPGLSFDGVIGISPIQYNAGAVRLGKAYEDFGINLYKNGAFPSGAVSFEGVLKEEAFKRFKEDFKKNFQGMKNTGMPIILENGGKFVPFIINPADAQLIENKKFQLEDIARIYRVPLHLIQNLDRATNNNIEHQSLEFVMYTMLPWFKRWEENANMQLLTRAQRQAGYYLECKIDGLLRGDAMSRARSYAYGRQWGWLSVNDIRRLENMSPIPNGDIYLEPTNMIEAGTNREEQLNNMAEEIYRMIKEGRIAA